MISVVMSAYNAEKYISEAIESILNQSFENFEFIIINDCSTDNTLEIIKRYSSQDSRIKLINNKENLGLTSSLNKAIKSSKGKYIARMDDDDISEKTRFEKQIEFLEKNKDIDIVGSFAKNIDEEGNILNDRTVPLNHDEIINILPKLSPLIHPAIIFRKKSLGKIGFYNEKFRTSQDYEMWFRAMAAGLKFQNLPLYLVKYRVNDNYFERKSFKYRINDLKVRFKGYNEIKLPIYKWYPIFIPLILGVIPAWLYKLLKKIDPR
jgi:glycosyltransferase involved in cell wall biosynthesis